MIFEMLDSINNDGCLTFEMPKMAIAMFRDTRFEGTSFSKMLDSSVGTGYYFGTLNSKRMLRFHAYR